MPDNRDTTNSCSQCEKYAKRVEELEAEVEKWRATCENDDWAGLKREQILEAEIERLTTEKSKGWTEAIKVVDELQALEDLHNSSMSAKVAGELRAELDIEYLTSLPLAEDNIGDDVVNANRVDDAITDSTDKEASDVCDD